MAVGVGWEDVVGLPRVTFILARVCTGESEGNAGLGLEKVVVQ